MLQGHCLVRDAVRYTRQYEPLPDIRPRLEWPVVDICAVGAGPRMHVRAKRVGGSVRIRDRSSRARSWCRSLQESNDLALLHSLWLQCIQNRHANLTILVELEAVNMVLMCQPAGMIWYSAPIFSSQARTGY